MHQKQINFINKYANAAEKQKNHLLIVLVMNVKGLTQNFSDYVENSVVSEYYSYTQYEEIIQAIYSLGYSLKCYFDENDFISDVELGLLRNNYPNRIIVINISQKGTSPGRQSLIPAFCQLHNILYAGSDAYTVSFARNKFHWYCFLKEAGYPVCPSFFYITNIGWLMNNKPVDGDKIILKLNREASSIGLSEKNIISYEESQDDLIKKLGTNFKQEIVAQKFINGYEIEVPIMGVDDEYISLFPAGIAVNNQKKLGDIILDYDTRGNHNFSYYDFSVLKPSLSSKITQLARNAAKVMGIKGYGRIDFRISENDEVYITDIAANPHITKSMTFCYIFNQLSLPYEKVLETLIGLGIS